MNNPQQKLSHTLADILFRIALTPFYLLSKLPYHWQLKIGRGIGNLLLWKRGKDYRTAKTNLQLCFPNLTEQQRHELLQRNFQSVGMGIIEMCMSWWMPEWKLQHLLQIHGREHVEAAIQAGKGAILVSPHFCTIDMIGRTLAMKMDLAVVYRPQKIALLDRIILHYRKKLFTRIIARDDVRGLVRTLRQNQIVWYAADGDHGHKVSVFVPFFGVMAASLTGTARLAKMTGAKVIPCFFYRRDDGTGYDIEFHAPLQDFPSEDISRDTERINSLLEDGIRIKPEQYIWQYKRFKSRPNGEARFYR